MVKQQDKIPWWRNSIVRNFLVQSAVLAALIAVIFFFGSNLVNNFQRLGLSFGFNFLSRTASFPIANPIIPYSPTDPYAKAILVGLINSLQVMFLGIIIATILGVTIGIGRLSDNWLVRKIATVYIETFRNIPLLLQLFFWYFVVFLNLPKIDDPITIGGKIFLTNRGMDIPWFRGTLQTWLALGFIVAAIVVAIILWQKRNAVIESGKSARIWVNLSWLNAIAAVVIFILAINWNIPQFDGQSIIGGVNLSLEFLALLTGLSIYTSAFIAEVVRAGIQSVNEGQWEAAKALGLKPGSVMQLVIFPQALRVMIPPLTSEFLNLAKNSSLASAIAYKDIYAVAITISEQASKSVEMLLIVMLTYLIINLIISLMMNWLNLSVKIPER
ncbi:amine acid ABC transporter, permease protein, 3-TM region, His/Glu/Gln/Arg/opine family [Xenococcus sp. PCC 7305]|uniref:amino acid ABC transporter permease n=1 Tax=Xenococcus sp. PCC 7305 TaxID=102125 RepID=UPI0002ACC2C7|nr:ABC transporter permease subunit [Xenococcus sp. PCC 7305]ELS02997.1 amine acid ABC transporter, permease protein, 3-TM region, His/Glu/Gln/Arg/opine family [Xenococcus sp. PCC 7305]